MPLPSLSRNSFGIVNATSFFDGVTSPRRKSMFERNCAARRIGFEPLLKFWICMSPPRFSTGWE